MEFHYCKVSCMIPDERPRYFVVDTIESFIYDHLREFKCLPSKLILDQFIKDCFHPPFSKKMHIMIRLTEEEAIQTASDRSEFKHPEPEEIKKDEKRALKRISKRKRSESTDQPNKKVKESRCPICLEDINSKKNVTLECDHEFHYKCIKKWLGIKKTCPTCDHIIDLNVSK